MSIYELGDKAGQPVPVKLIKNDDGVRDLSEDQLKILNKIYEHYADVMVEYVNHFETVHGHILQLNKQGGRFFIHDKGKPGRFDLEDMQVLMAPGVRWVEFGTDTLKVGL